MTADEIQIECSRTIKNILCEALLNFAYFSDEIKQQHKKYDIRKEILAITRDIERQFAIDEQSISLQQNYLDYCQRAINYHYDRIYHLLNANVDEQRKLMLNFLAGNSTRDAQLDDALRKDNVI